MIKSTLMAFVCLLLSTIALNAQNPVGKFFASSGIGLVSSYTGSNITTDVPPLSFELGYRLSPMFSINAHVGHVKAKNNPQFLFDGIQSQTTNTTTVFGLKNQFHKNISKRFELYGGAMIGYSSFKVEDINLANNEVIEMDENAPSKRNPNAPKGQVMYAGFIGGKLWATPNLGWFMEASSGVTILSTGLSVQF